MLRKRYRSCANPFCDRLVRRCISYCCEPCREAAGIGQEIRDDAAGHSDACWVRHEQLYHTLKSEDRGEGSKVDDRFREMEQKGAHAVRVEEGVRVSWPDGWEWLYWDGGGAMGRGSATVAVQVPVFTPPRRPWWRRSWRR